MKHTTEDGLHPPDKCQISFSSWARSGMCSFVLASLLKISLCHKEGNAVMVAGLISYLSI